MKKPMICIFDLTKEQIEELAQGIDIVIPGEIVFRKKGRRWKKR